ncbi:uncharacterized protein LOC129581371 [Paramacrobiotus metropolitanus]|uniref:uncharacterized protein LOC129581371 n=1 Tax=Paramacrobiotus metropolitanus TaxID=2943436 RepID=UPI00244604BF|nr:uncharacterized protein LOC129581371 [Paramacrobiotus metropolitanus]
MRDITGGLTLCSIVLQRDDNPQTLTHEEKEMRVAADIANQGATPALLVIALSGLVNAGMRFYVCIWLTAQAKQVTSQLEKRVLIKDVFAVDDVYFECQDFLERVTTDLVQISPFGCFTITHEFIISIIGVLMAHF